MNFETKLNFPQLTASITEGPAVRDRQSRMRSQRRRKGGLMQAEKKGIRREFLLRRFVGRQAESLQR